MNRISRMLTPPAKLAAFAPLLTLVVLVMFSVRLPNHVRAAPGSDLRMQEVKTAMEDVPFFIGAWIGRDEAVPPEAQKLLRPNAIFSRYYQKPGGPRVHMVIVHCTDARDMIGHYPPVCYPSAGWVGTTDEDTSGTVIETAAGDLPVRLYGFRRMRDQDREDRIRIFNAFILPDGTVTRDISDVNRQSERLAVSSQGVAQLQLITSTAMDRQEAVDTAAELCSGLRDLFAALRVGQGASRDP